MRGVIHKHEPSTPIGVIRTICATPANLTGANPIYAEAAYKAFVARSYGVFAALGAKTVPKPQKRFKECGKWKRIFGTNS